MDEDELLGVSTTDGGDIDNFDNFDEDELLAPTNEEETNYEGETLETDALDTTAEDDASAAGGIRPTESVGEELDYDEDEEEEQIERDGRFVTERKKETMPALQLPQDKGAPPGSTSMPDQRQRANYNGAPMRGNFRGRGGGGRGNFRGYQGPRQFAGAGSVFTGGLPPGMMGPPPGKILVNPNFQGGMGPTGAPVVQLRIDGAPPMGMMPAPMVRNMVPAAAPMSQPIIPRLPNGIALTALPPSHGAAGFGPPAIPPLVAPGSLPFGGPPRGGRGGVVRGRGMNRPPISGQMLARLGPGGAPPGPRPLMGPPGVGPHPEMGGPPGMGRPPLRPPMPPRPLMAIPTQVTGEHWDQAVAAFLNSTTQPTAAGMGAPKRRHRSSSYSSYSGSSRSSSYSSRSRSRSRSPRRHRRDRSDRRHSGPRRERRSDGSRRGTSAPRRGGTIHVKRDFRPPRSRENTEKASIECAKAIGLDNEYMSKMEEQKKRREEILRQKEQRRTGSGSQRRDSAGAARDNRERSRSQHSSSRLPQQASSSSSSRGSANEAAASTTSRQSSSTRTNAADSLSAAMASKSAESQASIDDGKKTKAYLCVNVRNLKQLPTALARIEALAKDLGQTRKCWQLNDDQVVVIFNEHDKAKQFMLKYNDKVLSGLRIQVSLDKKYLNLAEL